MAKKKPKAGPGPDLPDPVSDEDAKAIIMAVARARPSGFTEDEVVKVIDQYRFALIQTQLFQLVILGQMDCRWDSKAGETAFKTRKV